MIQINLWDLLAGIAFVIYAAVMLNYFSTILEYRRKNLVSVCNLFFAIVNFLGIEFLNELQVSVQLHYVALYIILLVELLFLSKSPISQIFYGVSVLMLHTSTVHTLVILLFSRVKNISAYELFQDKTLYMQANTFVFVGLFVILLIFRKFIRVEEIKKISRARVYANITSSGILLIFVYMFYDVHAVFAENASPDLLVPIIANVFLILALFYSFMLYTIYFIDMSPYIKKLLQIEMQYDEIESKRLLVEDEIDRDELTGFYNKDYMDATIEYICANKEEEFTMLFIDLNGLKYINDLHGHELGDRFIIEAAHAIRYSIDMNDMAARIGGDEFVVILFESDPYNIKEVIDNIHQYIATSEKSYKIPMSASIGSVYVTKELKNKGIQAILERADEDMRSAKRKYYRNLEKASKQN